MGNILLRDIKSFPNQQIRERADVAKQLLTILAPQRQVALLDIQCTPRYNAARADAFSKSLKATEFAADPRMTHLCALLPSALRIARPRPIQTNDRIPDLKQRIRRIASGTVTHGCHCQRPSTCVQTSGSASQAVNGHQPRCLSVKINSRGR